MRSRREIRSSIINCRITWFLTEHTRRDMRRDLRNNNHQHSHYVKDHVQTGIEHKRLLTNIPVLYKQQNRGEYLKWRISCEIKQNVEVYYFVLRIKFNSFPNVWNQTTLLGNNTTKTCRYCQRIFLSLLKK